jgi:hypothetical protein
MAWYLVKHRDDFNLPVNYFYSIDPNVSSFIEHRISVKHHLHKVFFSHLPTSNENQKHLVKQLFETYSGMKYVKGISPY